MATSSSLTWALVTPEELSLEHVISWATRPGCGAVVSFCGVVRDHSHERKNVIALEYETSDDLAIQRIEEVIAEARSRWPSLDAVAVHHRTGRVELSEPTVIVVVSSPHRDAAFSAAQYCIDTVKSSVPMWKREIWKGGSAWSADASPIEDVHQR